MPVDHLYILFGICLQIPTLGWFNPRSGRSFGEGIGNPLQYSCLENSMDREVWWPAVHGVAESWTWLRHLHFCASAHFLIGWLVSLMLRCISFMYILNINSSNICSHSLDCLFMLWWFPLLCKTFKFKLGLICLFLFFDSFALGDRLKIYCYSLCQRMFFLFFSSRSFMISGASLVAQSIKSLLALQETQVRSLGWEDPLEKQMATLSSILAWETPWIEEPGRL